MFRFILNDTKLFSNIFDTVSNILESGALKIRHDGLYVSGLDSSHVSFIKLELDKSDFKSYEYTKDIDIGINFNDFVKIIKSGFNNEDVIISCKDSDRLDICFNGGSFKKRYTLKLIYIDQEDMDISDLDYQMELEIRSKIFHNLINSILITESTDIIFGINKHILNIKSEGDYSDIDIQLNKGSDISSKIKYKKDPVKNKFIRISSSQKEYELYSCEGNFETTISINFIKNILKALALCPYVMCNLSPNTPLRLDFMLNDEGSMLQYYISPKIVD